MMGHMFRGGVACFFLTIVLVPAAAGAQVARAFTDLQSALRRGDRLTITGTDGVVTSGRFITLSDRSIRLQTHARTVDLPEPSVARMERVTGSAGKGALVGLIAGALAGVVAVAATPCGDGCIGPSKAEAIGPVAGLFGGVGAGIGAVVGSLRSRHRLIYLAPGGIAETNRGERPAATHR